MQVAISRKRLLTRFRLPWKELIGLFLLASGLYFFYQERNELFKTEAVLNQVNYLWLFYGIVLTAITILFQALLYKQSFIVAGAKVSLINCTKLFLSRNLISVFLPAGGITSLGFFEDVAGKEIKSAEIRFGSFIYAILGILAVAIVAIPIALYLWFNSSIDSSLLFSFIGLLVLSALILFFLKAINRNGKIRDWFIKHVPAYAEMNVKIYTSQKMFIALLYAIAIDLVGIIHFWIAFKALNLTLGWEAAFVGYTIAVVLLVVSPFLRGLGAIEFSVITYLQHAGANMPEAVGATVLFRFLEFWLPLVFGVFSFFWNKNNILLRILPAILLFMLGIVNTISALTPAIHSRLVLLRQFLPLDAIHYSNYFVLASGIFLMLTAIFLLRGLRIAWVAALVVSSLSLIGHLTKAIDYEEASLAAFTIMILFVTRSNYIIRSEKTSTWDGIRSAILSILTVMIFSVAGFYFLDKHHFGIDFTLWQSMIHTLESFFLLNVDVLQAHTGIGKAFLWSIRLSGILTMTYLLVSLARPYLYEYEPEDADFLQADKLVQQYGKSVLDYFKTYPDKQFFFNDKRNGFVSYRLTRGYAIALEEPVAENIAEKKSLISAFEKFSLKKGLKVIWYRVGKESLEYFYSLDKKTIPIGQEAVVNLSTFSLDGNANKSLRNAFNAAIRNGYVIKIIKPIHSFDTLKQLQQISDKWLTDINEEEMAFSQGVFDKYELRNQVILVLKNAEGKTCGFMNIVPDYKQDEMTYDLLRLLPNSPSFCTDFMMISLINYAKENGATTLNIGMAPLAGLNEYRHPAAKGINYAYEHLNQFKEYRGRRQAKDKYASYWISRYIVFSHHYDLIGLPKALKEVMKYKPVIE